MKLWIAGIAALGLLWGGCPAAAQTIIGNLPSNDASFTASVTPSTKLAMGFTMGGSSYSLTSATLRLQTFSTESSPLLELRADNGGVPGAVLSAFSVPTLSTGAPADVVFTPTSATTLQSLTSYWLTFSNGTSVGGVIWRGSDPAVTPTGPGATHLGSVVTSNNGGSWETLPGQRGYRLTGTVSESPAVPEPGALVLFLPALGAVVMLRRRTSA